MAKINEITGKLSGVVGPVVLVNGKNGQYIRAKNVSNNSKTEAQLRQRGKLQVATSFVRPMSEVLKRLYVEQVGKCNYFQAALSQVMRQGIGENGNIIPEKVLVSRGTLCQPQEMDMAMEESGLTLSWIDNSFSGGANASDRLVVVLYNPSKPQVYDFFTDATRRQGSCSLDVSGCDKGDYMVYATFITAKGQQVSNSCFVGGFQRV